MTEEHPVVARYMAQFEQSLRGFDYPEQQEAAHEIRNHIAEACAAGKPLDGVLHFTWFCGPVGTGVCGRTAAQPTDESTHAVCARLPQAYRSRGRGELRDVRCRRHIGNDWRRLRRIRCRDHRIGELEQAGIHLPGVQMSGIAPVWAIALGLLVFAIGILALLGLRAICTFYHTGRQDISSGESTCVELCLTKQQPTAQPQGSQRELCVYRQIRLTLAAHP